MPQQKTNYQSKSEQNVYFVPLDLIWNSTDSPIGPVQIGNYAFVVWCKYIDLNAIKLSAVKFAQLSLQSSYNQYLRLYCIEIKLTK